MHQENKQNPYMAIAITKSIENFSQTWSKASYKIQKNRSHKERLKLRLNNADAGFCFLIKTVANKNPKLI